MRKPKRTKVKKEKSNVEILQEADDTICTECFAEFLDPSDLEVHMQQMHPPGPPGELIPCQFCEQAFPNAEVYVLHIRDLHLVDLRHCSYCSRVYSDLNHLRQHERKHVDAMCKDKHSCFQCGLAFENNYSLRQHDVTHRCMDGGVFLNEYYALLSSVINIKADSVIKAIGKDFIYVCSRCKYSSSDVHDYIAHLKARNCRTFACNKCYKVYTRRDLIRDHIVRTPECSSLIEVPPLKQCSKCNKNIDLEEFKSHFKSCTILKCPSCSLLFENMYDLSDHQSTEHPLSVALITCKFCRKECVGKVSLDKHVERTHKHEFHLYKYTCTYCDTSFKHPQRLFAHYFMKHKDIEPYHCKLCGKKYRLRKPFTLHIKLTHESKGFVEFDERLHVFFAAERSEKPFQPVSKYASEPIANKSIKSKVASAEGDQGMETDNNKDEAQMVNVNSDFMNPTETEGNQTDVNESAGRIKRKRKTKLKSEIETVILSEDYDSEDEPLVVIKKKAKIKSQLRKRGLQISRKCKNLKFNIKQRFTCEICKKYCYTFQNYNNHLSMHFKDESKKCIKCSQSFKTKSALQKHLEEKHSSSKLTETLKQLLERRKKVDPKKEITNTQKFLRTVKKVVFDKDNVIATLSPVGSELSVQKFIENFTPEVNEAKNVQVKSSVSCTKVTSRFREPVIKMNKFQPPPKVYGHIKLSMPVRFKNLSHEKHSVTIRKVEPSHESKIKLQYNDGNQFQDDYDNDYNYNDEEDNKDAHIPEAEQEVTLEGTEELEPPKKVITHKIILPKLHKELKSIRIAHLLPEAPFYKIVKMDDIINKPVKKEVPQVEVAPPQPVQLPDGTKLVHVNPLAHLLGDTPIESLIKPHSKYYKPKALNLQDALAKALLKTPNRQYKKKPTKAKKVETKGKEATEKKIEMKPQMIEEVVEELETSLPCVEQEGNGNESLPCVEEEVVYESKSLPCLDDTDVVV